MGGGEAGGVTGRRECAHLAMALQAIAAAAGGRLTFRAESGVRRGIDVAKYLALDADAVLVGRVPGARR